MKTNLKLLQLISIGKNKFCLHGLCFNTNVANFDQFLPHKNDEIFVHLHKSWTTVIEDQTLLLLTKDVTDYQNKITEEKQQHKGTKEDMERAEALNYQLLDLRDDGEGLRQMPLLINSQRGFGAVHLIWKFMFFYVKFNPKVLRNNLKKMHFRSH